MLQAPVHVVMPAQKRAVRRNWQTA